ncbi:hypothetical protein [Acidithiobacillus sulfurivorans]|uniref:DGQHR domain-containing protein n=1 Tax=Acidithiobacillus sulfurivorans TaxID=1958756 RepID=A0ABS6A0N0_9PROT|nr:hypothetical protein [Acidithiobacillus sulfurivorans]MBU2760932.1 hypothetical protein [Acidithiobacillus sulfurivorans]
MKNFVSYFDDMPRRNATDDTEFVSGTVLVDSPDAALDFLGIADENVRAQMKRFKSKKSDICAMVRCYHGYIRELLNYQVKNGVVPQADATKIINERNRKVAEGYVTALAKQMKDGEFNKVSPQGLIFSIKTIGENSYQRMLIDGQNRLLACLVSRVAVRFHVQLTDNPKVFALLDLGKQREASTAANNDLFEQVGPDASLIQHDMPYLASMVLKVDPKKGNSAVQLALFSYLKYSYVDTGGVKYDMLSALYEGIGSELFESAFSVNEKSGFSQGFVAGMLRSLIESVETENVDAQRGVYAVIKQIAAMRRGDVDARHAPELDRIAPYLSRIFGMSNKSRGHRNAATMIFHALFSSIVFDRKDGFMVMMDRLDQYSDLLFASKDFNHAMSSTRSTFLDNEGNEVFLLKDIEQDLSEDIQRFDPYRNMILARGCSIDSAA